MKITIPFCAILFGIQIDSLFNSIAKVESDNGKTSANIYQITRAYVSDVNRITGGRWDSLQGIWRDGNINFNDDDRFGDRAASERAMYEYWKYYGNEAIKRGIKVTEELLANIHRYGFSGAMHWVNTRESSPYWKKVKRAKETRENL